MKRVIIYLLLTALLTSCSSVKIQENTSNTPLPSFSPSEIGHDSFFRKDEDYPNVHEVIDYCTQLIEVREHEWNDLTDCFETAMLADKGFSYSFEYEEYYNYGQSYLFKYGIMNDELVHEAVTEETELGVQFYKYLLQYGEIPFSFVKTYEGKNPITGYWMKVVSDEDKKPIKLWLIRGSKEDVMQIEKAFLSDETETVLTINLIPINEDWFIYWSATQKQNT